MDKKKILNRLKSQAEEILKDGEKSQSFIQRVRQKLSTVKFGKIINLKKDTRVGLDMLNDYIRGRYRQVPWRSILYFVAALIYFLNPFDLIPDVVPFKGFIDDATILSFVLSSIRTDLQQYEQWRDESSADGETESDHKSEP